MTAYRIQTGWPARPLWPNERDHYMRKHSASKKAMTEAFYSAYAVLPRKAVADGQRVKVTIYAEPAVARTRDDDNLISACKPARDGIARALGIDDSRFDLQPVQWGERYPGGRVIFEIESQ